jgi:hypothetical protein
MTRADKEVPMRAKCVAIISLLLLFGSTGMVTAQMNKEEIPAALVTGTVIDGDAIEDEGRVSYEQTVTWSDPRLPPTLRVEGAWYVYADVPAGLEEQGPEALTDLGVMVTEMNVLLDGPEGSWRGTGRGLEWSPDPDPDRHYSYYVLTGEGAYAGMHALLRGAPGHDANGPWDEEYEGWIIESELPPLPEPPSE